MYTDEGSETEGLEGLNKEVEEWRFQRSLLELIDASAARYWKFHNFINRQILQLEPNTDYYWTTLLLLPEKNPALLLSKCGFTEILQADSSAQGPIGAESRLTPGPKYPPSGRGRRGHPSPSHPLV